MGSYFEVHFVGKEADINLVRSKLGTVAKFITFETLTRLVVVSSRAEMKWLDEVPHDYRTVGDEKVYIFLQSPNLNAGLSLGDYA